MAKISKFKGSSVGFQLFAVRRRWFIRSQSIFTSYFNACTLLKRMRLTIVISVVQIATGCSTIVGAVGDALQFAKNVTKV